LSVPNATVSEIFDSPIGLIFTAFASTSSTAAFNVYQLLPGAAGAAAIETELTYAGLDGIMQYGLSGSQLSTLKFEFARFAARADMKNFKGVTASNIVVADHDRNSASTTDTMTFRATINDTVPFDAKIEYSGLMSVRLYLTNPQTGAAVFDSASILD
ncbi:MAG: hypothetical protein ABWY71_00680, partial [Candidatus Saccharimonadales bacterium]